MTCKEYTKTDLCYGIFTVFSEGECQELTSSASIILHTCICSGVTTILTIIPNNIFLTDTYDYTFILTKRTSKDALEQQEQRLAKRTLSVLSTWNLAVRNSTVATTHVQIWMLEYPAHP